MFKKIVFRCVNGSNFLGWEGHFRPKMVFARDVDLVCCGGGEVYLGVGSMRIVDLYVTAVTGVDLYCGC